MTYDTKVFGSPICGGGMQFAKCCTERALLWMALTNADLEVVGDISPGLGTGRRSKHLGRGSAGLRDYGISH